jgi:photosystem II stability/assembly factor-like uncharacterized protein
MKRILSLIFLIELLLAIDGYGQWEACNNGLWGCRVNNIAAKDNKVFISTSAGLEKSFDYGNTWDQIINHGGDVYFDGDNIFLSGVYFSSDNGITWIYKGNGINKNICGPFAHNGNDLFVGVTSVDNHGATEGKWIYYSSDYGLSWNMISVNFHYDIYDIKERGDYLYVATGNGLFILTKNGTDWKADLKLAGHPITALAIDSNNIFISKTDSVPKQGLYMSSDNGNNWEKTSLTNVDVSKIEINGTNIYAGTYEGFFISNDYGETWSHRNNGLPDLYIYDIKVDANNLWISSGYFGLYFSSDEGNNWSPKNNGIKGISVLTMASNGNKIYAGTDKTGLFVSTDYGNFWEPKNKGIINNYISTLVVKDSMIYSGSDYSGERFIVSSDNGKTWKIKNKGIEQKDVISIIVSDSLIFIGTDQGVFSSADNGESWIQSGLDSLYVYKLLLTNNILYAIAGNKQLYISTDYGRIWNNKQALDISRYITCITVNDGIIYTGVNYDAVYISTNGGDDWIHKSNGVPDVDYVGAHDLFSVNNLVFLIMDDYHSLYLTDDNGENWRNIYDNIPNEIYHSSLLINDKYIYSYQGSYGIYRRKLSDFVNVTEYHEIAEGISLFPNPVQNTLNMHLDQAYSLQAQVRIYDIFGQLVIENLIPAGEKEWKTDLEGLPAGTYFLNLNGKTFKILKI